MRYGEMRDPAYDALLATARAERTAKPDRTTVFRAFSVVPGAEFDEPGRRSIEVTWFCTTRHAPPVPYEEAIFGYGAIEPAYKPYSESYICELLTMSELTELASYLGRIYCWPFSYHEVDLPVPEWEAGLGMVTGGLGRGWYALTRRPDYSLSIPILGFYDLQVGT